MENGVSNGVPERRYRESSWISMLWIPSLPSQSIEAAARRRSCQYALQNTPNPASKPMGLAGQLLVERHYVLPLILSWESGLAPKFFGLSAGADDLTRRSERFTKHLRLE